MIDHYDWPGGREAMLRFGPAEGPVVVAALPLFEEANRTRTFVVAILRGLAERGIASALPDLPGTGESLVPTADMALPALLDAFDAAMERVAEEGRPVYSMALRSGALLDLKSAVRGRWQFAPTDGADTVRELQRVRQMAGDDAVPGEIAGNSVSGGLLEDLAAVSPLSASDGPPARIVRLESDRQAADRHVPGSPLWRRAEPDNDGTLAALLADDIAAWVRRCEG